MTRSIALLIIVANPLLVAGCATGTEPQPASRALAPAAKPVSRVGDRRVVRHLDGTTKGHVVTEITATARRIEGDDG